MSKINKKTTYPIFGTLIGSVMEGGYWRATKYFSEKLIIRATRRRNDDVVSILLSICPPNIKERKFIKLCKKAGEPFPIKKIQLQAIPQPRKLAKKK